MSPTRRDLLAGLLCAPAAAATVLPATAFEIACMTYVYRDHPLSRALEGIVRAGYRWVAWGTDHLESPGRRVPVMAPDAPPAAAEQLARRCRALGLEPVMLFSTVYPEHPDGLDRLKRRIEQAHAAGIGQVLTFGHTEGEGERLWEERFALLEPLAAAAGVMLVIKQHGGETGSGQACARFTRRAGSPWIKVSYDAGNVMDYLNVDPIPDLQICIDEVRSFCIKDHRNHPRDEDCGPGFGEIDHYRLLEPAVASGRTLPLCCENIFAPLLPRPTDPAEIDGLARRARLFLESVTAGLLHSAKG